MDERILLHHAATVAWRGFSSSTMAPIPSWTGLARTGVGGKVGFIDRKLRVVIPPRYDFAFPFNGGTAVVCNGCKETSDGGEHKSMVGGQWSIIDRHGREIAAVPDRSADERPK